MPMIRRHADELTGAIFLIGLGCLFYFGFWPGMLFLLAGITLIRALVNPQGYGQFESAATLFGIGIWVEMGCNIGALFIIAGAGMLLSMLVRNSSFSQSNRFNAAKPKSDRDSFLD